MTYNESSISLIWNGKRPRLRLTSFQKTKEEGGRAVPNITLYYHAYLLDNFMQWWNVEANHSWEIEQISVKQPLPEWALPVTYFSTMGTCNTKP